MRAIDADAISYVDLNADMPQSKIRVYVAFKDRIDKIPTITPERKRGKWETIEQQPYFRKHYKRICCSECKRRSEGDIKWNFCPNCGANMREGEAE